MGDIRAIVDDCERYWRANGIQRTAAREMRDELETHLGAAVAEGRSIESVVGTDLAGFAHSWAAAQLPTNPTKTWDDVFGAPRPGPMKVLEWIMAVTTVVLFVVAIVTRQGGESTVDNEVWRWIWVGTAIVMGLAEIVTAGFFLLPFAIGAAVAAVLAWIGVAPVMQLVVFLAASVLALVALQRYARREDERQPPVGANRYVGSSATVLEEIDRVLGTGRVRMDTEIWRATTDGENLLPGREVVVTDVRGARLVVEAVE